MASSLGNVPPASLEAVQSGLVRLRREFDMGIDSDSDPYRLDRLDLLDDLLDWIRPGVEAERARWDALRAVLEEKRPEEVMSAAEKTAAAWDAWKLRR